MSLNFELLVSSVKWARYEHERGSDGMWYQADWIQQTPCGTRACIAGHTVLEAGYVPVKGVSSYVKWREGCPLEADESGDVSVSDLATELLGLAPEERDLLFNGGNDIHEVEWVAKRIAEQHGYTWPN